MMGGVGGGLTPPKASAGGTVIPTENTSVSTAMQALITFERLNVLFGCRVLQFMFILLD
jgi:hypothetical protein